MTAVNTTMDEMINTDLLKEAAEADLIPKGRYRFTIVNIEEQVGDKEYFDDEMTQKNPFFGVRQYNCRLELTSKREGEIVERLERPRTYFMRVTGASIHNAESGKLAKESKLFGALANIATKADPNITTNRGVVEYFQDHPGELVLIVMPEREWKGRMFDASNFVSAIKAWKE